MNQMNSDLSCRLRLADTVTSTHLRFAANDAVTSIEQGFYLLNAAPLAECTVVFNY